MLQGRSDEAYDFSIVPGANWNDLDPEAIEAYRRQRRVANEEADELTWNDRDLVHALGGIIIDGEKLQVTVTGIICFGKAQALRRFFPSFRVDYIRIHGREWVSDPEKFDSTDMRGPIVTLASRVISAITDDLPKSHYISPAKSGQREEIFVVPTIAIREAVVNSLIHRSYQTNEPIQIIRYSNRIEFRNPGYSLKNQERFNSPGSTQRNQHICAILHETRLAETKGTGMRRMRRTLEQNGLSPPTFESDRTGNSFTCRFLFHHFLSDGDLNWLAGYSEFKLTEQETRAMIFLREVGAIDNSTYRMIAELDTLAASKSLRRLRDDGVLQDRGAGSATYYIPGNRFWENSSSPSRGVATTDKAANTTGSNPHGTDVFDVLSLPDQLRKPVTTIRLTKRVEPENLRQAIEQLCQWRELSSAELSALLEKSQRYLVETHLGEMVEKGSLAYTIPESPKHPGQRYKKPN